MPRKPGGEVNKSQSIRDLLKENPQISAREAVSTLANRNIKIAPNQFYFVKGKMLGRRGRRRKMRRQVASVMATSNGAATRGDVVATIKKVKSLAHEVGGLKRLQALVEALSE
jgi:hypothetical protein